MHVRLEREALSVATFPKYCSMSRAMDVTAQVGGASTSSNDSVRARLRAARRAIPPAERAQAERKIASRLRELRLLRCGRKVAVYLAMRGEANLGPLLPHARRIGCRLFVPRIQSIRRRSMAFVPLYGGGPLRRNRYGIAEPTGGDRHAIPVRHLDLILLPLVGFDRAGHRIGMGAGYYDRALQRRRSRERAWRRPILVGVAYACQESQPISPRPWDVAVDLIVTEREVIRPRPPTSGDSSQTK